MMAEKEVSPEKYKNLKLENQLCFPLYSAARKVISLYTPYLKPLGLTYTQYLVFLVLWEEESITVGELCRKLFLDNGTITPLLKKMESENYILKERSKEDERIVKIKITEKGMRLREQAKEIPEKVGACLPLKQKDIFQLYSLLYQILRKI